MLKTTLWVVGVMILFGAALTTVSYQGTGSAPSVHVAEAHAASPTKGWSLPFTKTDPLVGTWRSVGGNQTITFSSDGTFSQGIGDIDAGTLAVREYVDALRAVAAVTGTYARGGNAIVLTRKSSDIREATKGFKHYGQDTLKHDVIDVECSYVLRGDLLDLTAGKTTTRYVRLASR